MPLSHQPLPFPRMESQRWDTQRATGYKKAVRFQSDAQPKIKKSPRNKKLYSQPYDAIWLGLFPPCCIGFPCHTSVWLRKISLSDGKKPRPSGILRL